MANNKLNTVGHGVYQKGKLLFSKPKFVFTILVLIFVGLIAVVAINMQLNKDKPAVVVEEYDFISEVKNSDGSNEASAQIVSRYGQDYDERTNRVRSTQPSDWNQSTLDDVCRTLLYADESGSFTRVYELLSMLEAMRKAGINTTDNSCGISDEDITAIQQRADEASKKQTPSSGGGQS